MTPEEHDASLRELTKKNKEAKEAGRHSERYSHREAYGEHTDYYDALGVTNIYTQKKLEKSVAAEAENARLLLEQEEPISTISVDVKQAIIAAEQDLNFLASLCITEIFEYLFSNVHIAIWQLLKQYTAKVGGVYQLALGIPRGHAKTTIIKLFCIYCILFTHRKFILITCDTATKAENVLADVAKMLDSPNLISIFGDWKLAVETDRRDLKQFGFRGRNIILMAIGASGSVRGINLGNNRPDVMIFDDVQTKECSQSREQTDELESWMFGTAMKARAPTGCIFIYAGNMYPGENSILKHLKRNSTWIKFISGAILSDGTALWEAHRSLESLIDELNNDIAAGHPEVFFSEVMNDTDVGINSTVDFSKIPAWPWDPEDQPQGKFIVIDPSTDKVTADDTGIGYIEVYDEKPALRKLIVEKLSPSLTIKKTLLLALETGTKLILVENVAYQSTLLHWFEVVTTDLFGGPSGFIFMPINTGMHSKNSRIGVTIKSIVAGEVILHKEVKNLVTSEISNWNPMRRTNKDEILDLIGMATKAMEVYPALMATEFDTEYQEASASKIIMNNHAF